MQRIIVRNFLGIKEADISINKVLVLIGEQASGKSTLAKLIYFFQTLKDDIFDAVYTNDTDSDFDDDFFLKIVANKFYEYFGFPHGWDSFDVVYYYSSGKIMCLNHNSKKGTFTKEINDEFGNLIYKTCDNAMKELSGLSSSKNSKSAYINQAQRFKTAQKFTEKLNQIFESKQEDYLYTIAGRNATVAYSGLFEKYLFHALESAMEESRKQNTPRKKSQNIEEILMLDFIKKVEAIKSRLLQSGGLQGILAESDNKAVLEVAVSKIESILKGKYIYDNGEEKIVLDTKNDRYVALKNASSGQQEIIRILQDLFLIIADKQPVMRIIEEPEANLFPVAQKAVIELMALMVSSVKDSQIILTTHSPYILSVLNNLLFAKRVATKNPATRLAVNAVIAENQWLDANEVSVYSLGNSYDKQADYCQNLLNPKTGTIDQNYLDSVSGMLGEEFDELFEIHAKSYVND